MKKLLIFDLDDTLIYTNNVFIQVTEQVMERFRTLGIRDERLFQTLDTFDREMVATAGHFHPSLFGKAVLKTYAFYCEKLKLSYQSAVADDLSAIAARIISGKYLPIEGAETLLRTLRQNHDHTMLLVTRGDPDFQMKKLRDNHLEKFFQEVVVVPQKNAAVFEKLIKQYEFRPENTWIIGNSLRAEILPAQELGANCIFVTIAQETWDDDLPARETIDCIKVDRLSDCLNIINK